jgi:HD-like signal output (HDOD) protein
LEWHLFLFCDETIISLRHYEDGEAMLAPIEIDPKTFLRQHCTLPALPAVVGKIQSLIQHADVDMKKVAELINSDPAVLAQVLKIVNSAYYGLPREVTNVQFAIAFLGLNEVYRMVLSLSVINTLAIDKKNELNEFWFHSFYSALCTKYLAKKYEPHLSVEELWSAAMLHDIGRLVYLKFFPDHYRALIAYCKEHGSLFSEAERHFSLPSSAFLGTLLCEHWRLPNEIRQACEFHTLEDLSAMKAGSPSMRFQWMICLGNLLTVLSTNELSNTTKEKIADASRTALDCTEAEFLTMMGDIYELRIDVETFMEQLH